MKFTLAPLAGFTDAPFRRLAFEGGADLTVTEMVSAAALAHGHNPTLHLLETMPGEGPVACQLFGAKEDELEKAVEIVMKVASGRFTALDLNAGCPMAKVTKCGAGAALVREPAKIGRLLAAMRRASDLPVTLKTRLGPHPGETTVFDILGEAEAAGASGIAVHARYTSQCHGGPVHLDTLAEVVARAKIPVTGNGSVTDAATARAMAETGVAGLMIGRAAVADPCIFSRLKASLNLPSPASGAESDALSTKHSALSTEICQRHLEYLLAFRDALAAKYPLDHVPSPDGFASVKMHVHLFRYFNGRPGAAALRARLNSVRTLAEIRSIIDGFSG